MVTVPQNSKNDHHILLRKVRHVVFAEKDRLCTVVLNRSVLARLFQQLELFDGSQAGGVGLGQLSSIGKILQNSSYRCRYMVLRDVSTSARTSGAYCSKAVSKWIGTKKAVVFHVSCRRTRRKRERLKFVCLLLNGAVCMYVCLMSWGPTEGQQTKFCLCKFMQSKHCSLGKNSS